MKMKEGWDGSEEENNIQWTFAGALFYSIIVITTIGESIFQAWSKLWRRPELVRSTLPLRLRIYDERNHLIIALIVVAA